MLVFLPALVSWPLLACLQSACYPATRRVAESCSTQVVPASVDSVITYICYLCVWDGKAISRLSYMQYDSAPRKLLGNKEATNWCAVMIRWWRVVDCVCKSEGSARMSHVQVANCIPPLRLHLRVELM